VSKIKRVPKCHPELPYYAKELCKKCHRKTHHYSNAAKAYSISQARIDSIKRYNTSEKHKDSNERYRTSEKGKDKITTYRKTEEYRLKNNEYKRQAYSVSSLNINSKLAALLRSRMNSCIKGLYKSGSAVRDLGCSIEFLKTYLESQFQSGMTWENWSMNGWHIDHILPLSSFDLTDREQLLKACHYTNLQPLWAKDNLSKGKKYDAKDDE
jgi:hypothetical protein